MAEFISFKATFEIHALEEATKALFSPLFSAARLRDAHTAWRDDLLRLEEREKNLTDGADHFKQCANLAYWLRRMSPVIDYRDLAAAAEGVDDLYPDEVLRREFMTRYGTEFLAFDFGFKICAYYELERLDNPREDVPFLSQEYLTDVCHMMKFKHVSPHALFLIYKSLFLSSPPT